MNVYRHAAMARAGIRSTLVWAKNSLRKGTDKWWTEGPEASLGYLRLATMELGIVKNGLRDFAGARADRYEEATNPSLDRTPYRPLRELRKCTDKLDAVRECLHFGYYHQALCELEHIIAGVFNQLIVLNHLANQKEKKMQSKEQLQKRFRQCSEHIEEYIGSMTEEFYSDGGRFDYGFAVDTMYDIRFWAEEAIGILEEMKEKEDEA